MADYFSRRSGIDRWIPSTASLAEILQPANRKSPGLVLGRLFLAVDCHILSRRLYFQPIWTTMGHTNRYAVNAHWRCHQYVRCRCWDVGSWQSRNRGRSRDYEGACCPVVED
jgi:hypothetical protein